MDSLAAHSTDSRWRGGGSLSAASLLVLTISASVQAVQAEPAQAGIFLLDSASDEIVLSNHADKHGDGGLLLVAAEDGLKGRALRHSDVAAPVKADRRAIASIVADASRSEGVESELLHAVIGVESGYEWRSVSRRGALGLMQLMPATAKAYGAIDAFDPRQNVRAGARYLRYLLNLFGQNMTLAVAAYNAGPIAVSRYGLQVPPFPETLAYVPRVLARYAALRPEVSSPRAGVVSAVAATSAIQSIPSSYLAPTFTRLKPSI